MSGVLGKYQLDYRLGGGGMAEVFIAHTVGAEGFTRKVAIKRVLPGFSENPQFAKMFVDEARISSRLQHPNIVSVVDFDRDPDGRLFLVMELVEGKDLDSLMSVVLVPYPVTIFIISEMLRGLGYAHDLPTTAGQGHGHGAMRGIVHRDVSPHNVLLSWEGAVKVSDFGIAKARSASEATASEFIKGKPAYMSPEQANGERLDGRSDLFAVGIMLWEMLCGRRLFVGEDTRTTLAAVLFGAIPRPRSIRPDVPKDLERVCMKLLERDLPNRYPTAEHAIAALLECKDAPKAGREELIMLLAERFVHEAPVRQHRSKPGRSAAPPPMTQLGAHDSTIVGYAGRDAQPAASIGQFRAAQTGTLGRGRGIGTGGKVALGLVAAAAAGGITFGLVTALGERTTDSAATDIASRRSGSGSSIASAVTPPSPAVDAAPVTAPPPPPDAAPASPPDAAPSAPATPPSAPDAAPVTQPASDARAASGKKYGYLDVIAYPVLTVSVDGSLVGDTPVTHLKLKTGKHRVKLTNGAGASETVIVDIADGKTWTVDRTK